MMSRWQRIAVVGVALCGLGILAWLRLSNDANARAREAGEAALAASKRMTAADEALQRPLAEIGRPIVAGLAFDLASKRTEAAAKIRALLALFDEDIAARDELLVRSAAWFELEPEREAGTKDAIAKIRAGQPGLRRSRDNYAAIAEALETGAPNDKIEALMKKLSSEALLDMVKSYSTVDK